MNESRNTPGPGHYESQSLVKLKNAPKYKIGNARRSQDVSRDKLKFPDPQTYNPTDSFIKT
jgi:hypothetical protein